jgi:hypothetical protein
MVASIGSTTARIDVVAQIQPSTAKPRASRAPSITPWLDPARTHAEPALSSHPLWQRNAFARKKPEAAAAVRRCGREVPRPGREGAT